MKKNVILLSVLSFVLLFASCKKDKTINEMKNTDPTEQKILSFKAKLQNPEKNNETMRIDSAVWYIEAALNYTYCDTAKTTAGIDSFFVNITIDENNEINFNNIVNAYNQLNTDLQNTLGNNTMRLADVEFINNNNKSNEKQLKLTVVKTTTNLLSWNFGPDDNWYFSEKKGKCDGTCIGNDAVTQLNKKANYSISYPVGDSYLTDIERLGYWNIYFIANANYCCPYNQLNNWLNIGKSDVQQHKPTNKDIVNYEYWQDILTGDKTTTYGLTIWGHYGIWHVTNNGNEQ